MLNLRLIRDVCVNNIFSTILVQKNISKAGYSFRDYANRKPANAPISLTEIKKFQSYNDASI